MLGSDRIIALDIGASTVKIGEFQAGKAHGLRLTNFNYAELGIDPEHEENRKSLVVSTIRNALREKGIKSKPVIFSVSGQSVFTRFVKLPPVDESKVVQIIQYEAQQNVPFPIDEVIWDYQLLGNSPQGELEVVLLAIKSDIIEELTDGVQSAGLRAEMVDVAPMALFNAVRYNYGDLEGCTVVVDIGARTTNLLFIEQNRVFSRSIPIAGNAITQNVASEFSVPFLEAEQMKKAYGFVALGGAYEEPENQTQARVSKIIRNVMTRLHAEVARSINFYRSQQSGGAPTRLLLSGGSSIIPYTDRFFKEKVQIPIEYFNPFRNVEIDPQISREELARCAHFFGEVVGLGLRKHSECPIEVNLVPKSLRMREQLEQKRPYLAGAAICILVIPLCWLAYTSKISALKAQQLQKVSEDVNRLSDLSQKLTHEQQALTDIQGKADQIVSLVQQRSLWPEILQDINVRIGSNLWVVSLTPQGQSVQTGGGGGHASHAAPAIGRGHPHAMDEDMGEPAPEPVVGGGAKPTAGPRTIAELRIEGAGAHLAQNPGRDIQLVEDFAKSLRQSPFFDKAGIVIDVYPNPAVRGPTFTFLMRAKLQKQITL
ncbi:MAG TPA: type IV pilus assembly protein PilM [Verrucomicrobiae bacterium]|nr:type IV pilus assembly protein PilM [Verrucomicrobiae bacterium]